MKQNTIRLIICPALLALLFAGCVKRELEMRPTDTDGFLKIALDWSGTQEAQVARLLIYDQNRVLVKEQSEVTTSALYTLAAGTYYVVAHNTDASNVNYRGMESHHTAEVFAQNCDYTFGRPPVVGMPCIREPQALFATGVCREAERIEIVEGQTTQATVALSKLTHKVRFSFITAEGVEAQTITGVLGGLAPGIMLASGNHNTSSASATEFTAEPQAEAKAKATATNYVAQINTFGLLTDLTSPAGTNTMTVKLTLTDGKQFDLDIDLTAALQQILRDNGGVYLEDIPLEVTFAFNAVGLGATVAPWDDSGTGGAEPRP